ncbi:MAG: tetratricopeptide repeat protein [Armatimonadota bacterium]
MHGERLLMSDQDQNNIGLIDGVELFKQGKYTDAILVLEKQLAGNPDDIQSRGCLAACYSKTGRTVDAIQAFLKLTELQPDNAVHYFNLGIVYDNADNPDRARECFEKVLALNPGHQKAQQWLDAVNAKIQSATPEPISDPELGTWPINAVSDNTTSTTPPPIIPPLPAYTQAYEPPIPPEIGLYMSKPVYAPGGLNWGGFLLPFWWGIAHRAWLWVIVFLFIPILSSIVLLIRGNDIAFENREYSSMEEFESAQRAWTMWGIGVNLVLIMLSFYVNNVYMDNFRNNLVSPSGTHQPVAGTQAGELAATIAEMEQLRKDNEQFGGFGQGTISNGTDANGSYAASTITMPTDLANTYAFYEGYVKQSGGSVVSSSSNSADFNMPLNSGVVLIHIESSGGNQTTVITKVYKK